jgi:hypothetical protein
MGAGYINSQQFSNGFWTLHEILNMGVDLHRLSQEFPWRFSKYRHMTYIKI